MDYTYIKALHIIFVVTWFAGLFYMPRLFIYATEAGEKSETEKKILRDQLLIMTKRLWYGITWPSAILTLIFGTWVLFKGGWQAAVFDEAGRWLLLKLIFVFLLYLYHFSLQRIVSQEAKGIYRYTSQQLRMWNEVSTVFLVAIVMLVVVKQSMSFVWGLIGILVFIAVLMIAIQVYKKVRGKS
jgi:putative membrane protein